MPTDPTRDALAEYVQPLTEAELDASDAICNAATPEPWNVIDGHRIPTDMEDAIMTITDGYSKEEDFTFVCHARTALPRANAEIRRLRASLRKCHLTACTADNCVLDGGPEHDEAFKESEAAK